MRKILHQNHISKTDQENGNVLFIILIAVAMFAALSYTVGNMLQSGNSSGMVTDEKARLMASEILDYGRLLKDTVQDLQISNGCTDDQISFENDIVAGYTNANAPSDNSCNLFHPDGGGLAFPKDVQDTAGQVSSDWYFDDTAFTDFGTTASELVAVYEIRSKPLCSMLNEQLGLDSPTTGVSAELKTDWQTLELFTGSYTYAGAEVDSSLFENRKSACATIGTGNAAGIFYQILITR